jgi:putative ABC transport system permease protein
MVSRIAPVQRVTTVALVDASVRRTDLIPELETGGLSLMAVEPDLLEVLGARMSTGRFIDEGLSRLPVAVLGEVAAERLGVGNLDVERLVHADGTWLQVVGIADDLELHPDLERSAMIGYPVAGDVFGEARPTAIYARFFPEAADDVTEVLPATVNPENPDQVEITRPADALAAREAADAALTQLLIALGSVALLVGGVAIANVMVMSVLERRMEIGVRRALGATRAHVRRQFLFEAVALAGFGGLAGVGLGAAITVGFATIRRLPIALPVEALAGAVGAALAIGAVAGLYPASRAARIPPSQAVRGSQ